MKMNDRMRYPHPVLSEYSSDYVSGEFRCQFEQSLTTEKELKITAELAVDAGILTDLIADQRAALGYFLVCPRTYYDVLQPVAAGRSEKFFDASRLFGRVLIRPVIWTLTDIDKFKSPLFDNEFGKSVAVAKGSIIAIGPEFQFSMDQKKYKPFDSIFELAENPDVAVGRIEVDPFRDRITIQAESKTYKLIEAMRHNAARDLLLSVVYMPAVMEVLCQLQLKAGNFETQKWYAVFKAKCDDMGINPADAGLSPLSLAQELLREPLKKSMVVMEKM